MKNSRALALEILLSWNKKQDPVDGIMDQFFSETKQSIESRDVQLVMAMVFGVFRWRGYLDSIISKFSSHPLAKMKPPAREALRLGLFQIIFLDRVPESAAINETVNALKAARQPKWICGFVNGVLRAIVRQKHALPLPGDAAALLSHPAWMVERWQSLYGINRVGQICAANNSRPRLSLRVNTKKISVSNFIAFLEKNDVVSVPGKYAPAAVVLPDYRGPITAIPGYNEGLFWVQDEGAQLIPMLLAPFTAGAYLDGCAGLGGKSLVLARELQPDASLVAVEPSEKRVELLRENMNRVDARAIKIYQETLQQYASGHRNTFSGVLLDVPCSGTGVIKRHPEIRWSRNKEDLARYNSLQLELLSSAAGLVGEAGLLVYATCSIDKMENDEVVGAFLESHPEFCRTNCCEALPEKAHCLVDENGFFRTLPDDCLDGFFAARLRKQSSS